MSTQPVKPYQVQDSELLTLASYPDREYLSAEATKKFTAGGYTHIEHSGLVHHAIVRDPFVYCGEPVGSA